MVLEVKIYLERDYVILCFTIVYLMWFCARTHFGKEFEYVNNIFLKEKKKKKKAEKNLLCPLMFNILI